MADILVTGGAGFIGSAFLRKLVAEKTSAIVLDALTYAGHYQNIEELVEQGMVRFVKGDIADTELVLNLLQQENCKALVNFAAESHVDNSIAGPKAFIQTNVIGTFQLLEACRDYCQNSSKDFRFLQVSTDEVYGSLGETGKFDEKTPMAPNSPYSASKAGADHLVRAWHHTYGLPTIITHCSNNYGPRQFPEKLIPLMIDSAINGRPLPVYGDGRNVRDWIHVEDHSEGIWLALNRGEIGETYCFGGDSERANLEVVGRICDYLNEKCPRENGQNYRDLIQFVEDRLGHDRRYAIDDSFASQTLGFRRRYKNFEEGLISTVDWYLENQDWVQSVKDKK